MSVVMTFKIKVSSKEDKASLGRLPIPKTGGPMKSKKDYTRKKKHKKKPQGDEDGH